MGSAMAARLIGGDRRLTVWNRSKPATEALERQGARTADSPAEAVQEADAILTMLSDDEAMRAVALGSGGFIKSMKANAIHISLSTISVELARELTRAHLENHQEHLGSPVFGRPQVAADGKLWLALGGKPELIEQWLPILSLLSRGHSNVGNEPWQAHALKLGGNFMITATIQMMAEAFVYARSQGIDPAVFIETVNSALFQSQFIANYAKTMLNPPEKPGATVSLGIKDTRLFCEAAHAQDIQTPLADYLAEHLDQAKSEGWQNEDWAVGQYLVAQKESQKE
jgi:3-hydroxyisobutyrate dehydrogenase-like beta-hydroxyacid dehydrogenase